jgi:hypothetical protein
MRMKEAPTGCKGSKEVRVRLREDAEVNQRRQRGGREDCKYPWIRIMVAVCFPVGMSSINLLPVAPM